MNHLPLVSVVIPTYNRSAEVCAAVDSVLRQTYPNVEAIIVDDGSTDDTQPRLKVYGDKVRVSYQDNAGPAAAMNRGISLARGEFVSFLGSDDLFLPRFVESCVLLLLRAGAGVPCCIANAVLRRLNGKNGFSFHNAGLHPRIPVGLWVNAPEVLLTRFVLSGQTMVIRRDALARTHGFDESLRYLEDYQLALHLSMLGPWAFTSEPLVTWQQSGDSLSRKGEENRLPASECALRVLLELAPLIAGRASHGRHIHNAAIRRARMTVAIDSLGCAGGGSNLLGTLLRRAQSLGGAGFRRSPWYPKMQTTTLAGSGERSNRHELVSVDTGLIR